MLRGTDVEIAFMVEGGVVDGHIIFIDAEVVPCITYLARLIVIVENAIHTDDEHGLWTMLDESDRGTARRLEVLASHLTLTFDEARKGGEVATLPEIMMLVFVDVGEEDVCLTLGILPFVNDALAVFSQ